MYARVLTACFTCSRKKRMEPCCGSSPCSSWPAPSLVIPIKLFESGFAGNYPRFRCPGTLSTRWDREQAPLSVATSIEGPCLFAQARDRSREVQRSPLQNREEVVGPGP